MRTSHAPSPHEPPPAVRARQPPRTHVPSFSVRCGSKFLKVDTPRQTRATFLVSGSEFPPAAPRIRRPCTCVRRRRSASASPRFAGSRHALVVSSSHDPRSCAMPSKRNRPPPRVEDGFAWCRHRQLRGSGRALLDASFLRKAPKICRLATRSRREQFPMIHAVVRCPASAIVRPRALKPASRGVGIVNCVDHGEHSSTLAFSAKRRSSGDGVQFQKTDPQHTPRHPNTMAGIARADAGRIAGGCGRGGVMAECRPVTVEGRSTDGIPGSALALPCAVSRRAKSPAAARRPRCRTTAAPA